MKHVYHKPPQPQPPRWYEPALVMITLPLLMLTYCVVHIIKVLTGHEFD
jgi:hypothetical protein